MKNFSFYLLSNFLLIFNVNFAQNSNHKSENFTNLKSLVFDEPMPLNNAILEFEKVYNLEKGNTFKSFRITESESGTKHERFQQFYKNLKVEFGTLISHSNSSLVNSINGELYDSKNLNLIPTKSSSECFQLALQTINAQSYLWEDKLSSEQMNYTYPVPELVIFPMVNMGVVKLAYKFDIYATSPESREDIYIDAHTGLVLFRNFVIKHAHDKEKIGSELKTTFPKPFTTGTAATKYSGSRSIETKLNTLTNKYNLNDLTRGGGIYTYNSSRTNTRPSTNFSDTDNNWTTVEFANAFKDDAALDAHWGAEKTFDFWKNIFNRNSFDDNNAIIKSYVHYDDVPGGAGYSNAFWNGSVMTYGDGSTKPLTSIDVCGHEIGHAICSYTANLVYANQSGAMNEGFSDIWGACIEQYGRFGNLNAPTSATNPVWLIGEDLFTTPLRSMSNPNSRTDPDTLNGTYYIPTADDAAGCVPTSGNDQCGVHTNSGVLNHWFYILTSGKAGTNNAPAAEQDTYNVTGIGMTKSAQIAYFAERDFLTPNATFADARNATIAVASSLYCVNSPEVIAVTDAWNAVNVGAKFISYPNDVVLKSVTRNLNVACGASFSPSLVFENGGTNPITSVTVSYNIDSGANAISTWNGTLAVCSSQNYTITIPTLTKGTHILNVTTTITSDGNSANNTKSVLVIANEPGTINTINTFENSTDNLVSYEPTGTNVLWERGTSNKVQLSSLVAGSSKVYATNLNGLYPDRTISYLVSQCYDLSNIVNPMLKFDMAFDLETDWDIIFMQYSTNSGTTWSTLGSSSDLNWYTSGRLPNGTDCFNCIGSQWTGEGALAHPLGGTNDTKRQYSYNLSNFSNGSASPQTNIIFRFVFQSDDASVEEGAIIDNFVIEGTLNTKEFDFEKFNIYPNPSNGNFTLELSTSENVKINLTDVRGRTIFSENFINSDVVFKKELNFNSLSSGIYLLNIESQGKNATKKILIN